MCSLLYVRPWIAFACRATGWVQNHCAAEWRRHFVNILKTRRDRVDVICVHVNDPRRLDFDFGTETYKYGSCPDRCFAARLDRHTFSNQSKRFKFFKTTLGNSSTIFSIKTKPNEIVFYCKLGVYTLCWRWFSLFSLILRRPYSCINSIFRIESFFYSCVQTNEARS